MRKTTSLYLRLGKLLPGVKSDLQLFSLYPSLEGIGWVESRKQRLPVDNRGEPLPWYTYPAIHFLRSRVPSGAAVFEYGVGNSTRWWAGRCTSVVAYEHDCAWAERIAPTLPKNASAHYIPHDGSGQYALAVLADKTQYHIVVIDGVDRNACADPAVQSLTSDGVIIWDNSDRSEYAPGYAELERAGFRRLDFQGFGPINGYDWCTSIFYRDGNCLGL